MRRRREESGRLRPLPDGDRLGLGLPSLRSESLTGRAYARYVEAMSVKHTDDEAAKSRRSSTRSPGAKNREWMRRALKEGFAPLTADDLKRLAVGTPEEGEQIRRVAEELRAVGKGKRKRA